MLSQPPAAIHDPGLEDTQWGDADGNGTQAAAAGQRWSPPIDGHGVFKALMVRLPRRVRRSFDHEQLLALRQAAEELAWGEHPIDIRLSLPLPHARHYLVLVGGKERRHGRRHAGEWRRHPLVRTGNIVSMLVFVCLAASFATAIGLGVSLLFAG
jgi:hypothetical protein